MRVFIDPGHGGADRANRGPTGYIEADGVLDIAARLNHILEKQAGIQVKMSREVDETVPLYDRPKMANAWSADILVSIHTNAANDPKANGVETYYSYQGEGNWGNRFSPDAKWLAHCIQSALVSQLKRADRGIKTRLVTTPGSPIQGMDYYAVIRRAACPAVVTEICFHTNPEEEALLKTAPFRQAAAEAVAKGILAYAHIEEAAGVFKDVPAGHWAEKVIQWAAEKGLLTADKGNFRPNDAVTRAELAAVLNRLYFELRGVR